MHGQTVYPSETATRKSQKIKHKKKLTEGRKTITNYNFAYQAPAIYCHEYIYCTS